jgi:hypothetical protein
MPDPPAARVNRLHYSQVAVQNCGGIRIGFPARVFLLTFFHPFDHRKFAIPGFSVFSGSSCRLRLMTIRASVIWPKVATKANTKSGV